MNFILGALIYVLSWLSGYVFFATSCMSIIIIIHIIILNESNKELEVIK